MAAKVLIFVALAVSCVLAYPGYPVDHYVSELYSELIFIIKVINDSYSKMNNFRIIHVIHSTME